MKNPLLEDKGLLDPYQTLATLQSESPVYFCEKAGGWFLTRYDHVKTAFLSPVFTAGNIAEAVKNHMKNENLHLVQDYIRVRSQMMLHNDGGKQRNLRKPFLSVFSHRGAEFLRPLVKDSLEKVFRQIEGKETFDIATDFAEPYSTQVMANLFDVPDSEQQTFQKKTDDVSRFFGNTVENIVENAVLANDGVLYLESFFSDLIQSRKKKLGHDLLSQLIRQQEAIELSDEEILAQCVLILMAGHYTVIDQICNTVHTLITLGLWEQLDTDQETLYSIINESIRYDGAVLFMARILGEDFDFEGYQFKKGQTVFLGMGAANRDPSVYESPDQFVLKRQGPKHMGFGLGAHQCLGMHLGILEIAMALRKLYQYAPNLQLKESGRRLRKSESLFFRGFYHLDVSRM